MYAKLIRLWSRATECRPQVLVLILLPCLLVFTLFFLSENELDLERLTDLASRIDVKSGEVVDGYLVWNPKCRLIAKSPLDPSITKYVKKEKYQTCSSYPAITRITRESNGSMFLTIIPEQAKRHGYLGCCWAPVHRPVPPFKPTDKTFDSRIQAGECENFKDQVHLNNSIEVVLVRCRSSKFKQPTYSKVKSATILDKLLSNPIYSNVHAVLNPEKVRERLEASSPSSPSSTNGSANQAHGRKLSVLMIGMDSVSRLGFHRSMSYTKEYMDKHGWLELRGYNKMGDNTYPNLMAFLAGMSEPDALSICNPYKANGLDNCPLIWHGFRNVGYVTAYGEDVADLSTFNFLKVGFTNPPTDYYLRPYVVATEKLLSSKRHFGIKYCTGPEPSFFRILNFAQEFVQTFLGRPYFGFFWTNSASHDDVNAPSSVDTAFLSKLQELERAGVMNDSMVIVLSDHGMRFGKFRTTPSGWYEERLPFVYFSLPPWFREQYPEAHRALSINRNRLTSPFDLHMTLRDVLLRAGGSAPVASGCPNCSSLFEPVPKIRGCSDVGVDKHWCSCAAFQPVNTTNKIVMGGAYKFLEFVDTLVKDYKKNGTRMCAKFRLKKIHRASQIEISELNKTQSQALEIFYMLEVSPGGALFETTVRYDGANNYTVKEEDVSRINSYYKGALCLKKGRKKFCECVK